MSLKYEIESLEGLSEQVKELYEEKDGKHYLNVDLGGNFIKSSDVAGLKANRDELLAEKKEQKRLADESAKEARKIRDEAASKSGDVEAMKLSWDEERQSMLSKIQINQEREESQEKSKVANEISNQLAKGHNVGLLSRFVIDELIFEDGKVKSKNGSSIDELTKKFKNDESYKGLMTISGASGSGATDNQSGGAEKKTITRSEFDALSQIERSKFFISGGNLANE